MTIIKPRDLNITDGMFISKIKNDLKNGVKMKSGKADNQDIIRVWTDAKDWQFNISASGVFADEINPEKIILESFGISKVYIILKTTIQNQQAQDMEIQKLSQKFGLFDEVQIAEAQNFIEGYINSTFNRYLTQTLFNEVATNKNYEDWLIT